jgi:hypothetical protein
MKKPVLQSVALASLAVGSIGGAEGALTSPSFSCLNSSDPTAGGTVSWPYATVKEPLLTFDFFDNADISSELDCSGGTFSEAVVARKSGEGQKDFLKITMKEVLVAGFAPANDYHIKFGFTQVLGELKDGVQTFDAYWDITGDYLLSNFDGGFTPSTHFLGIKLQTTQKFDGLSSIKYDYQERILTFSAELQTGDGVLSFTSAPRVVDEPATLALLGTGLLGAAALRRRRRGW